MKHLFILFALISLSIFTSCDVEQEVTHELEFQEEVNKPAEVNFTVDNKDYTLFEKDDLLITNNSLNAVSYHWDFGNGDTSSEERPNYEFDIHGYYTITLTITDILGNTHEASQEILVLCVFGGGPHDF